MRRYFASVIGTLLLAASVPAVDANSPWGANYFPNTPLITQDGEDVRFFDDLIEGKVVLVNFIYTACVDTCPLETAQLVRVQRILGDRLGKDVFFYSISIDPEHDTPAVLAEYKERFGANWTFLTGEESEIIHLRRKLGLYVEEIQDGSLNHNVNMIIGNQATGLFLPISLATGFLTGGRHSPRVRITRTHRNYAIFPAGSNFIARAAPSAIPSPVLNQRTH